MRLACALMLSGCSLIGVHRPTSGPIEGPVHCESALPYFDAMTALVSVGIVGASAAMGFAQLATLGDGAWSLRPAAAPRFDLGDETRDSLGDELFVTTAVTGVSALYGFFDVDACRAHVDDVAARMQVEAHAAARAGRCDEVVEVRSRLERIGRELDMHDPSTKACFPYSCASGDAGFCACSQTERDCEPAVRTGLAPACVPEPVDICTAVPGVHAR